MANKKEKHIIVDEDLHAEVKAIADAEGRTIIGQIRQFIKEHKEK